MATGANFQVSEFGSPAPIPPGFEAGNIKTMPESSPRSCPDHSFSTHRRLPLLDHLPTQAHSPPDHSHATFPLLAFQAPTTPKWIEERKNENGGENSSALFGSLEDDSAPPNLSNTTGGKGAGGPVATGHENTYEIERSLSLLPPIWKSRSEK